MVVVVEGGKCPTPCGRGNCPGGGNVRGNIRICPDLTEPSMIDDPPIRPSLFLMRSVRTPLAIIIFYYSAMWWLVRYLYQFHRQTISTICEQWSPASWDHSTRYSPDIACQAVMHVMYSSPVCAYIRCVSPHQQVPLITRQRIDGDTVGLTVHGGLKNEATFLCCSIFKDPRLISVILALIENIINKWMSEWINK